MNFWNANGLTGHPLDVLKIKTRLLQYLYNFSFNINWNQYSNFVRRETRTYIIYIYSELKHLFYLYVLIGMYLICTNSIWNSLIFGSIHIFVYKPFTKNSQRNINRIKNITLRLFITYLQLKSIIVAFLPKIKYTFDTHSIAIISYAIWNDSKFSTLNSTSDVKL